MIKKFKCKFLEENLPLEMRLFNVTLMGALFTSLFATIGSYLGKAPIISLLAIGGVLLFLLLLGIVIHKVGSYKVGCNIAIIVITVFVYPIIYITGGGIDSGMCVYWVLLIVLTFFVVNDSVFLALTFFLQATLFIIMVIIEYNYPDLIFHL